MFSRRSLFVALAALTLLAVTAGFVMAEKMANNKGVTWQTDFNSALKQAEKADKPLMVDFYTDWCGWCKKLDQDTYPDSKVTELSRKFIAVKLNGDKYPDLVKKYKVNGYPSIVFLNSKGVEVSRVVGYQNADTFLKSMQTALNKAK